MASIKRDDHKQKWEDTEFPLVCETCLGDNPYVRMTKEPHGKACKICEVPFTVFAWQAGTRGRLKKVEICRTCARTKNVCQVCIYDLQYGLPVAVRDRVLAEEGDSRAVSAVPQSDANRAWFNAQNERAIEQGSAGAAPGMRAALKLRSMARMEPRYERNLPKLCSFFARGECNRGSKCPFRHEMPRDRNDPLSKQNTKDRFYGTNDPVADKMIGRRKERADKRREEMRARGDEEGDERAVSTLYMRFVDASEKDGDERGGSRPPPPRVSEADIRDKFYSYGEISSVRMHKDLGAFVEYTTAEATELAILSANRSDICGRKIYVNWARQPKRGNEAAERLREVAQRGASGIGNGTVRPAAPPGGLKAGTGAAAAAAAASLSSGFKPVRPPAAVAAASAARAASSSPSSSGAGGVLRVNAAPAVGVPRPGGGPIRRAGASSLARGAAPKPYYPSADPGRLGSRATQDASSL